jgi:hypothetical protein
MRNTTKNYSTGGRFHFGQIFGQIRLNIPTMKETGKTITFPIFTPGLTIPLNYHYT